MNYEIKNKTQLHNELLPILKEGDTLTKTYTNKYGDKKVMTFDFSLSQKGRPVLVSRKKYKYEYEYVTYEFYNTYQNYFGPGFKLESSIVIQ